AVAGLVDQARQTFLSGAAGGRHPVLVDLPPDLPRGMADGQRIVQVLNNLLANAARHAPELSTIRVAAVRDGVHVAVSVSDEGRGVPPEQLPHLFRKHAGAAGGGEGERGLGGYGLGLAICKGLVEAHGGRIWAESAGTGQGTRFTFTIPAAEETGRRAEAGLGPGDSPPSGEPRPEKRILVVDDDPQTLRYVRDALDEAGYLPLVTGDPRELPELIKTEKPQLVLLDLMLPGTDGIELMERIPELAEMPVIFLSGYRRDETIARALELGAADYIVKPFSPTELTARVRAALRRSAGSDTFVLRDLAIDYERRRVTLAGRVVELTATEYEMLRVLSVRAGRMTTHDTLLRQAWQKPGGDARVVRAVVKRVRRKLGDDATRPTYIFTEQRVGYRMPKPGDVD
ncbi:MAG: response regulator, partial [Acidobacteria bacterium]|nr:response regulator [Acidobacteriota bacterium]